MWNSLKLQGLLYFTQSSDLLMTVAYSLGAFSALSAKLVKQKLWTH